MKYKILYVHPSIILDLCKNGSEKTRVVDGKLPPDTKFIRAFTDDNTGYGRIGMVIESESFKDLKDGDLIPIVSPDPLFERVFE